MKACDCWNVMPVCCLCCWICRQRRVDGKKYCSAQTQESLNDSHGLSAGQLPTLTHKHYTRKQRGLRSETVFACMV